MGFNSSKWRTPATEMQILEGADHLVAVWNERSAAAIGGSE
jgi:hypothetical protein